MDKYEIDFSSKAIKDIKQIIRYIRNNLKEPDIAEKYADLFIEQVSKLNCFPEGHPIIEDEDIRTRNIRRLLIRNYVVFYRINEEKKIVTVERVLYGASNWKDRL